MRIALLVILMLTLPLGSVAQMPPPAFSPGPQALVVATGASSGTYARFFKEITDVCNQPALNEWKDKNGLPTSGSRQTLDLLTSNLAAIGFVQIDSLFARQQFDKDDRVAGIKTLLVLYPEEVHIVARQSSGNVRDFEDLGNKKVASWGGSLITAWTIFGRTGIRPVEIRDVGSKGWSAAKDALDKGEVHAIIAVGGQPYAAVQELGPEYKLVPFTRYDAVKDIYDRTTLNGYSNLSRIGVETISTQSALVTRDYKTPERVKAVTDLRRCILDKLPEIRETTGTHPKWELVSAKNTSRWPAYEAVAPKLEAPVKAKPKN